MTVIRFAQSAKGGGRLGFLVFFATLLRVLCRYSHVREMIWFLIMMQVDFLAFIALIFSLSVLPDVVEVV